MVATAGRVLTVTSKKSQKCANCGSADSPEKLKRCSSCKETLYCSKRCQNQNWAEHKGKCTHLPSARENSSSKGDNANTPPLLPRVGRPRKVTSLVGRQCLVECYLNGHHLQALWDTGSQVSVIDERWKEEYFPTTRLRDVSEILDSHDDLTLTAANGTEMPYLGWIETVFQLASETDQAEELIIPVLVMKGWHLSHPIIGFNVIEHILTKTEKTKRYHTVRKAFPSLKRNKVRAFIQAVSTEQEDEYAVKTKREEVAVSKHSSIQVNCRVATQPFKEDMTMLFQPDLNPQWPDGLEFYDTLVRVKKGVFPVITIDVANPTDHDIVLPGRTLIGTVQTIMTVLPAQVFEKVATPATVNHTSMKPTSSANEQWDPQVDLSHLSEDQREVVRQMLREECYSFSRSDSDIGCIEKLHFPQRP